jgi:dihydrodipicolinate synthase/N-acetylneuraminate lyase
MSGANPWRGLFPATALPFHEDLSIDEENLRGLIRFPIGVRGVSGLACNGHAEDAWALTREERDLETRIHVEEAGG